jgi:hypothetical protein
MSVKRCEHFLKGYEFDEKKATVNFNEDRWEVI